jgi:hypothetical protein
MTQISLQAANRHKSAKGQQEEQPCARFEILSAGPLKIQVFWDVTLHRSDKFSRRF